MVDRIPSGTRDVLPDEMRELRAMTDRVRSVFEQAGYGEVQTPALEYEGTFERANMNASRPASRSRGWLRPATGRRSRRCASPTSRMPIAGFARSADSRASSCKRASS